MKKFFVVLSLLACFLGLSVSAMAYQSKSISEIPFIQEEDGVHKLVNVLYASKLNATNLELWKEIVSVLQGGGTANEFVVITVNPTSDSLGSIYFTLIDSDFYYSSGFGSSIVGREGKFTSIYFLAKDSFTVPYYVSSNLYIGQYSSSSSYYILRGAADLNSIHPLPDDAYVIEDVDYFWFQDDLGSFEEPEEPDPPSSSEPSESIPDLPKPNDYNPTLPTIPSGDGLYVPYDTAVWDTFLERTKQNIGSATNIGFLIFGIAVVWSILTRLVKRFTKP